MTKLSMNLKIKKRLVTLTAFLKVKKSNFLKISSLNFKSQIMTLWLLLWKDYLKQLTSSKRLLMATLVKVIMKERHSLNS